MRSRAALIVVLIALLLAVAPASRATAEVTTPQVAETLKKAVQKLKQFQGADGTWTYGTTPLGMTGLAILALKASGAPNNDPAVVRGVAAIRAILTNGKKIGRPTYELSLAASALAAVDGHKYKKDIKKIARWFEKHQGQDGTWNYGGGAGGDNSNNQFGVLALKAAWESGVRVNPKVIERALKHFSNTQQADGGWSYRKGGGAPSTGAMTSAGLASMVALGARYQANTKKCGEYKEDVRIAAGLNWLAKNFSAKHNPIAGRPPRGAVFGSGWYFYYMYAMERVGIFSARRFFGQHDWYREGSTVLVEDQAQWRAPAGGGPSLPNLCFGILFLAKGTAPIVIHKLTWPGHKPPHTYDIQNLNAYASTTLNRPLAWQTISLNAPLKALAGAPILFINGHDEINFTAAQRDKLAAYVAHGGTILAEACCGSKKFDKSFRTVIKEIWKDRYELKPLAANHGLYNVKARLTAAQVAKTQLEGIDIACKTSVIYMSNAHYDPNKGMSCEWDRNRNRTHPHFKIGLNIIAYVIGDQVLHGRLDEVDIHDAANIRVRAGSFVFAQLNHEGDADPHPLAGTKLMSHLTRITKIPVGTQTQMVEPDSPELFTYPFVYMTGHNSFDLTDGGTNKKKIKALRQYLTRGGFLFADPCCGEQAFTDAYRKMIKQVFPEPNYQLQPLPLDHPIFNMFFDERRVKYKSAVLKKIPNLKVPILYGLYHDERLVTVLAGYNIGCGIEEHTSPTCKGYGYKDAQKLAINIILYAMTHG